MKLKALNNVYVNIFVALVAISCTGNPAFVIEGSLPDSRYDGRYMYLVKKDVLNQNPEETLDSIPIENKSFQFTGKTPSEPVVYDLVIREMKDGDNYQILDFPVIIESGKIIVTYDSLGATVKGTPINDRYNETILTKNREIVRDNKAITAERAKIEAERVLSTEESESFNGRIKALYKNSITDHIRFVEEYKGTRVGEYFFFQYALDRYPAEDGKRLFESMSEETRARFRTKENEKDEANRYFQESMQQTKEGFPFREITGKTEDGTTVNLSDYAGKGNVVLVDFWASWCGPCIQEIPALKELQEKYKDKGFLIFGVSLDTDKDAWTAALKKHNTPWVQISDLQGFESKITKDYGISAIPFLILIDGDGTIILRNLRGKFLDEALEKALN
ncbi:MAG TPA: hypothetical protein DDW85_11365 [Porphyromonadaceae bacterium]|jgi:thiol-disulfide isomerase/thioredoxin|nr:hypothetical protein [Porphyromonadaceae bacterium]